MLQRRCGAVRPCLHKIGFAPEKERPLHTIQTQQTMTLIRCGQSAGRGSEGSPPRTRPWRPAPRADGRAGLCRRGRAAGRGSGGPLPQTRPRDGRGDKHPARTAGRGRQRGRATGSGQRGPPPQKRPMDGRCDRCPTWTAVRHMSLRTCGGEGERRPAAAADISAPRG